MPPDFAARVRSLGGSVHYSNARVGFAAVDGVPAALLGTVRGVASVDPDIQVSVQPQFKAAPKVRQRAQARVQTGAIDPSAAYFYPWQWNMRAIKADAAWAASRVGSASITVAILDTGIDYRHPDLAGRVDLRRSRSFVPWDDAMVAAQFPGVNPITDLYFHGTHVAATVSSNAVAAAGMTTNVTLIGIKVLDSTGNGSFADILAGLVYAADNGAHVANMSLSGSFPKNLSRGSMGILNRTLNYAHAAGTLVVIAAGNEASDLDHDANTYLAFCNAPNVVCVSATGPTSSPDVAGPWANVDSPAPYTNYGRSAINVAAPGGANGGFVWAACSGTSIAVPECQTGTYVLPLTGTSMAAPHVTGLAALLADRYGRSPAQIRHALTTGADDLGQSGTDPFYGKGRINVQTTLGLR